MPDASRMLRLSAGRPRLVRCDVAPQASVGDSLTIIWDAPDASSVTLQIEAGDERTEYAGASSGAFLLSPSREGLILLRLVAQGPFTSTVATRTVRVKMPKPRIE